MTDTPESEGMDDATAQAFREMLQYMLHGSGVEWAPGIGMSVRGAGGGWEVYVGAKRIGWFEREALLEAAAAIRRRRAH